MIWPTDRFHSFPRLLLMLAIGLLPALATAADAPQATAGNGQGTITLNFVDTEIREVASSIGEITGKNFILDPRVKGRVTVVSSQPISIDAVYETFLSVLQVHNFAAVPSGKNMIKIIPSVDARQVAGNDLPRSLEGPADDIVTQIVEVQNVEAAQLVPILRPLVPQTGHLAAYPGGNMLIVSDRAANVERLIKIIRRMDQTSDEDIEVVPLEHASASETVRVLSALSQGRGAEGGRRPATLVADDRTNSILLGGDKAERMRMRALISHLDTPLESGGNTQVIYLRYANAESLASILKGHVTEAAQKDGATGGGGENGGGGPGKGYADVVILHEPDTNALVVTAPPKVMRTLQTIIEKLDIRRAQVHVEAIIAEIASSNSAELGITWAAGDTEGENPAGLTNFPNSGLGVGQVGAAAAGGAQNLGALLGQASGLTLGFGRISDGSTSFVGLLRALAGNSTTNILSTPSLTTMDNEEAEIKVGQEVPFLTGSFTNTGANQGNVNPFQTIQRKEVGLSLKLTPQISDADSMVLTIAQEVSSLSQGSQGAVDLVTDKRTINTSVLAESGEIIVLGGLIDERVREGQQRVPILGSIPVLGQLFRYDTSSVEKRNLMVFIKPSILRTQNDAGYYTNEKYRYIRRLQEGRGGSGVHMIPGQKQPVLPHPEDRDAVDNSASDAVETEAELEAELEQPLEQDVDQ